MFMMVCCDRSLLCFFSPDCSWFICLQTQDSPGSRVPLEYQSPAGWLCRIVFSLLLLTFTNRSHRLVCYLLLMSFYQSKFYPLLIKVNVSRSAVEAQALNFHSFLWSSRFDASCFLFSASGCYLASATWRAVRRRWNNLAVNQRGRRLFMGERTVWVGERHLGDSALLEGEREECN